MNTFDRIIVKTLLDVRYLQYPHKNEMFEILGVNTIDEEIVVKDLQSLDKVVILFNDFILDVRTGDCELIKEGQQIPSEWVDYV